MKTKIISIILLISLLSIAIFVACETKPTQPEHTNVYDPKNPSSSGDPFHLQAAIGNGGVTLTWTKPASPNLANFKIYRSENETSGYSVLNTVNAATTRYVDQTIQNGHSYWYRMAAVDGSGSETGTTNVSIIHIKTDPMLVINSDSLYTKTKEVELTILANTARQMKISNAGDFSGVNWEPYNTSKNWTLLTGQGEKIVYMKVQYNGGAESPVVADTISPQPMNPSISIAGGAQYTSTRNVSLTFSATGSNLEMKLSEDSTFAGINWQTYTTPSNFQLSTGEDIKKVFAKFKNDFEIETSVVQNSILLDTTPPVVILVVSPDSGITNETQFQFDPTGSYDNIFPSDSLQIRFDWENDGTYDTNWRQLFIINNLYPTGGGDKTVKIEIRDVAGWTADTTIQIFVNTRPAASFTTTQGTTNLLLFYFDASASSDYEDGTNLLYRWDFTGDGSWETGWLARDTISYSYSTNGDFLPKLSVRDLNNLTAEITVSINIFDGTLTDIDGNVYQTVKIGAQWWMSENLKVTQYRNGDAIPNVTGNTQWSSLSTGAYCAYGNAVANVAAYGMLYNWYAVDDSRNIAPVGWHVPTDDEWKELEMYLGMSQSQANATGWRGTDEGSKLKEAGTAHWTSPNTGATNSSGFTALPGGYRNYSNGTFYNMYYNGYWWSDTENSTTYAWSRYLKYNNAEVNRYYFNKRNGFGVRCLRD